jgi:hypothetical protein
MFYQCSREKKPHASRHSSNFRFNHEDYIAIHHKYSSLTVNQPVEDPKACLGIESVMSYKAAIQKFHADQRDARINNCSWQDDVWLAKCEKLLKVVKGRKQRVKKSIYPIDGRLERTLDHWNAGTMEHWNRRRNDGLRE